MSTESLPSLFKVCTLDHLSFTLRVKMYCFTKKYICMKRFVTTIISLKSYPDLCSPIVRDFSQSKMSDYTESDFNDIVTPSNLKR